MNLINPAPFPNKIVNPEERGAPIIRTENYGIFKRCWIKKYWPNFYRILNSFLYFILSVFKGMVSLMLKQIKE